jgi:uncharacterized protein (DUF427 family)
VERCHRHVLVVFAGQVVADTRRALRVLETSDPPVYYVPPGDYLRACFRPAADERFCEWKGVARSFDIVVGERVALHAAWSYPNPVARYAVLQDCMALYLGQVDACYVDGERVRVPHGRFRGGWITSDVAFPDSPAQQGR